jgi:hypothetical protein
MNNLLLKSIPLYTKNLEPQAVVHMGAYGIKDHLDAESLRGARQAWVVGLRGAWAMMIAWFGIAFLSSFIAKWPGNMVAPAEPAVGDTVLEGVKTEHNIGEHV